MKRYLSVIAAVVLLILMVAPLAAPSGAATDGEINDAIERGLAWLASQQSAAGGFGGGSVLANTAAAVLAFENEGHFPGGGSLYSGNVERGLDYIFTFARSTSIYPQTAGYAGRYDDPDTNGNGKGIYFIHYSQSYETGMVMQAIADSQTPNRVVTTAPVATGINGMTYEEVLTDVVDWYAWGQIDYGNGRGGWYYNPAHNSGPRGDNSVSQWPCLGFIAAEQWGIDAPEFVKSELTHWIDYVQNHTAGDSRYGGSGYSGPYDYVNPSKTGGLLVEMYYYGDDQDTIRADDAIQFINRNWMQPISSTWYGNRMHPYAMFAVFKGLTLMGVPVIAEAPGNPDTAPGDWWGDYCEILVENQNANGSWNGYSNWNNWMATAWYIVILQATVFPVSIDIVVPSSACDETGYDVTVNYSVERFPATGTLTVYKDEVVFDTVALTDFSGSATANYNIATDNPGSRTWKAVLAVSGGGISVTAEDTDTGEVFDTPDVGNIPDQILPFDPFDLDDYLTCACPDVEWAVDSVPAGWTVDIDADNVVTVAALEGTVEPAAITFNATITWRKGTPEEIECTGSDTAIFTPNQPPVADAGKDYGNDEYYEVVEGGTVEVDGSASWDPDGDQIVSYDWDMDDDGYYETPGMIAVLDAAALGFENPPTTRVYIYLQVEDEHGATGIHRARVEIRDAAPIADFMWDVPPEPMEGSQVQFRDLSTSAVDEIVDWAWDFGDGTSSDLQNPTHEYGDNGTYEVTLTVTDDDGSVATIAKPIEVGNIAPLIDVLSATPEPVECCIDEVSLTAIFKDPGWQDTHTGTIDWGDGSEIEAASVTQTPGGGTAEGTHTYCDPGVYTVTLTIVDDDGGVDMAQTTVTVVDETAPVFLALDCVETVNPHGSNVPGKNRGKNDKEKNNQNPDGFYEITFDVADECDEELNVYVGTLENPLLFEITSGIKVKFTEDADAAPEMKKMGSPPQGGASAITWHIILPSDPVISVVDDSGNITSCTTCLVPPPPM